MREQGSDKAVQTLDRRHDWVKSPTIVTAMGVADRNALIWSFIVLPPLTCTQTMPTAGLTG